MRHKSDSQVQRSVEAAMRRLLPKRENLSPASAKLALPEWRRRGTDARMPRDVFLNPRYYFPPE